jgi:hypothetical protein
MRLFRRNDGRYYAIAEAHRDLLGDSVIMTIHGSSHSRRGGVHTYPGSGVILDALVKTRLRHGYAEVPCGAEILES